MTTRSRNCGTGGGPVLEFLLRGLAVKAQATGVGAAALAEIGSLAATDYGRALRGCLSRYEVREVVNEGRARVWPDLNRRSMALVPPGEFVQHWSALGVDLRFANLSWKRGLSLLGFYLQKNGRRRTRPLIFVNTAHHPAIVGAALGHEMGHHLTSQIFALSEKTPHLFSLTAFKDHLADPAELAADTLVSLASVPTSIARAYSGGSRRGSETGLRDPLYAGVLEYLCGHYGLRCEMIRRVEKKIQALAALVHYTKLRRALWDEYQT